jgi:oligosaccharide reducing-end xylanase
MKRWNPILRAVLALCTIPALQSTHASGQSLSAEKDGSGAYATGIYRNLFAKSGHSEKEIDTRIHAVFQQLFHGDPQTQAVYYESGHNANGLLAYVTDIANHDVRTEGMSYGMMIAVQTNHKTEFDALWNWANTYMLVTDTTNPSVGYFAWSMRTDGTPNSDSPAPDGEEYFVMSLYFAAHRWGNGQGIYDYQAQADRLLALMRHHAQRTGTMPFRLHPQDPPFNPWARAGIPASFAQHASVPHTSTVGPMVNEANHMIVFVPGAGGNTFSDPSYHLPAFYELWARWGPVEDRAFWIAAAKKSREYFSQVTNPKTGLAPDFANFDGSPRQFFSSMSENFSYDAWRVVSNWSVDQAWWGKNPEAEILSNRIQSFLISEGLHRFADRYTLDGKPLSNRHSVGMVSTTAVGSLAAGKTSAARAFVDELWATPCPSGEQRYYDGLLYAMSLLHASGHFRIWMAPIEKPR